MKITAAVLCATKQPFTIETIDLEEPHAGEVLVEIKAVGICHSDWHLSPVRPNTPCSGCRT